MEFSNGIKNSDNECIQVLQPQLDVQSVIKEITKSGCQEDAFYICNISDIIRKYKEWKLIMPRIETHYAVKCNDSKVVLEVLASLGIGFDCASQREIQKLLSLGVTPNRIIFANPTKKNSHIKYAAETGVSLMTFENVNELYKIKKYYPDAKLVIRIKYDDLSAKYVFGQKYGCDHKTEALELLRVASTLELNVIGVCFHIGSGSQNFSIYADAIAAAKHVFDVAATVGYSFNFLDIGGGFPGEQHTSITEIGVIINTALEKHFSDPSVRVISEPGRYYVNSAFSLVSNIHSMKSIIAADPVTKSRRKMFMYYVDASVYGALIPVIFKEYFPTKALKSSENVELHPSIIWGPTCDKCDKISENVDMLPEMSIGDWIIFEDAGAYTLSIACEFNGFPNPKVHSIIDKESWIQLTEKVQFPISKDRFVLGNTLQNFRTGLIGPNKFRNNYYW